MSQYFCLAGLGDGGRSFHPRQAKISTQVCISAWRAVGEGGLNFEDANKVLTSLPGPPGGGEVTLFKPPIRKDFTRSSLHFQQSTGCGSYRYTYFQKGISQYRVVQLL